MREQVSEIRRYKRKFHQEQENSLFIYATDRQSYLDVKATFSSFLSCQIPGLEKIQQITFLKTEKSCAEKFI
jgi:hypothetical protein